MKLSINLINLLGEELTSTAKLKIPPIECEACSKKSNSFNFLNVSLRRRNIPSPIFDESTQSGVMLNNSEVIEMIQPQPLPSAGKSLGDELLEMNFNKSVKERRKVQFSELVGRMFLLEMELNNSRYALVFYLLSKI